MSDLRLSDIVWLQMMIKVTEGDSEMTSRSACMPGSPIEKVEVFLMLFSKPDTGILINENICTALNL